MYAERAAAAGAKLVVLPELTASGYSMSRAIWDAGELRGGPTSEWLSRVSRRLGIHLGVGFMEADGEDFFNTYAIGTPEGRIAGYVRKTMAETYFFRGERGSHVIETELGRIGVCICADGHFAPMLRLIGSSGAQLAIMPHAWPAISVAGGASSRADVEGALEQAKDLAPLFARALGIPAVFANMVGQRGGERWIGIIGSALKADISRYVGNSTIADSDGSVASRVEGDAEGLALAEVSLDPARARPGEAPSYGRYGGGWLQPGSSGNGVRDFICGLDGFLGGLRYRASAERRRKARELSSRSA
jgi:N-carbamoylputrescine amidase